MIAADLDVAKQIAAILRGRAGEFRLSAALGEVCDRLLDTADAPTFPGALIPEVLPDGALVVVAAATPADWRRLSPVLRAFAGPTLTSFDGVPSTNMPSPELASVLATGGPHVSATIRLPSEPGGRDMALRAMLRARDTFARAPLLTRAAPEPTSWLLARFQDHLNVGRRDAAADILERLRDELRLDALNLRALQVQLLATFDDWSGIVSLPGFDNLTRARRAPATTALLLEALYQDRIATVFDQGDQTAVERRYSEEVRALAAPMLQAPVPTALRPGGVRLAGLEALATSTRGDLATPASARAGELSWLADRIAADPAIPGSTLASASVIQPQVAADARDRLIAAAAAESVDAMAAALAALARLSDEQRAEIAHAEPFRSALRGLHEEVGAASIPTSWPMWLARTSDPAFVNALDLARMGARNGRWLGAPLIRKR